jgi:hypothetical protein
MKEFLLDFGRIMQEHEGRVTGTFDLMFPNAGPGRSDVRVTLTYPDWSRIGSIPAPRS